MGIFADILNPNNNKKKTGKDIVSSITSNIKPAGSTNLPIETTTKVKSNANKILANIKAGGSTPIPKPVVIPKKGEVISQASGNTVNDMPFKVRSEEGKRIAQELIGNNFDDDSIGGLIQNTIRGLPKATVDLNLPKKTLEFITGAIQGITRSGVDVLYSTVASEHTGPNGEKIDSVGNTIISKLNEYIGTELPKLKQEYSPDNIFTDILIGKDEKIRTIPRIIDVAQETANQFLSQEKEIDVNKLFGQEIPFTDKKISIPATDYKLKKWQVAPIVVGSILLDLNPFGGGVKKVASATFKDAPEFVFKDIAKDGSSASLEKKFTQAGLDEVTAKNLAFETAPLKTVFDVKEAIINYEKRQQSKGGVFSNILKEGQQTVDNVVEKGISKPENMTDIEFKKFIKTPEGITYAKKTESNIPEQEKDKLFSDINKSTSKYEIDTKTTYYRGGPDGKFITEDKDFASEYGKVKEYNIPKNTKLLNIVSEDADVIAQKLGFDNSEDADDIWFNPDQELDDALKSMGYDGFVNDNNIYIADQKNIIPKEKPKPEVKPYKETGNLTTKILKDLEGKTTVSRQYIVDSTKRQGISGSEVKIINDVLAKTKGDVIDVAKFAEKVKKELIPLTVKKEPNAINQAKKKLNDLGYKFEKDMAGEAYMVDKDGDYVDYDELPESTKRLVDTAVGKAESYDEMKGNKYEAVALPKETRGDVKSYKENIYEGKIKTDGSPSHFGDKENYMLHTRVENMADGKTRRVIEVQSDLYQKGNLEKLRTTKGSIDRPTFARAMTPSDLEKYKEAYRINNEFNIPLSSSRATPEYKQKIYKARDTIDSLENKYFEIIAKDKNKEISKLEQYKNPTIHYRGVREEIKKAVDDGIEKLQFPTGETAMKVEGLGSRDIFALIENGSTSRTMLSPENAKVGIEVRRLGNDGRADNWIVTDVLEDGKFKAIPKSTLDWERQNGMFINQSITDERAIKELSEAGGLDRRTEQFDISGKVDTSNPIYKFYENDLAKYLKNNYDSKLVTDNKGVTWNEVTIKPEMGGPVTAFKRTQGNLNNSIRIKSSEVKKIIGEQLKGIVDPDKIEWVFDKKLAKKGIDGRFTFNPRMQYLNPRLKPMIELYERWGKVSAGTAFHESYHYIESVIFSKEFVRKLDKMTLERITKDDIRYYKRHGYKGIRNILAEYRADAFATERLAKGGFKKGKMQQVLELMDRALRRLVLNIKKFINYYNNLPNRQGGFAKNPFAKKIKEELPEDLQRMKDMIDIKEEALAMNPMRKLAKYESKKYQGELPEFTGTKIGKFTYDGKYQKVIEDISKEIKYDETLDIKDIEDMYKDYVKQRQELVEYKREYQKERIEYYANKKNEISKKELVEKDEKALEKILNQQAKETENLIYKTERADRLKEQLKETQKRLADEQAYKDLYKSKVKEARTVSFKRDSFYQTIKNTIKRTLAPVKLLDPKSKEIYTEWKTKLIITKELANVEASNFKSVPIKDGMNVINAYEAGKVTEYTKDIKTTFDALRKEALDRGLELGFRENYIPHVYKENAQEIKNAIANYMVDKGVEKYIIDDYMSGIHELSPELATKLKLNPSFTKDRTLPTYKIASEYGLTPKYENPAQLVAHYREEMEKTLANRNLMKKLEEEVKILPSSIAPKGWKEIELPYGKDRWYAKKELANIINSEISTRDVSEFGIGERFWYSTAKLSKKLQEIKLSAGVPASNINFFSMGVALRELTYGNFKVIPSFIRANFNDRSIQYFKENRSVILDMAKQGIDVSNRIGNYADVYNTLALKWNKKEHVELFGATFDKLFNEKTFGSFMPQLTIQSFKDVQKRGLKLGMSKEEADRYAANVVRNIMGIVEDTGRGKITEDVISAIFFAPKFRESIINLVVNNFKAGGDMFMSGGGFRRPMKPELYRNRRLIAGLIITYAIYDYLNQKFNGNHMWENESGRDMALKIPIGNEAGDIAYTEFQAGWGAFPRNMFLGTKALIKGDFKTAAQKYGGLFSMPIKLMADAFTNSDYFGREIYKDSDTRSQKILKVSKYVGLQVNHPYLSEALKYMFDEKKTPPYQIASILVEAPFKFSTEDKVAQNKFYEAQSVARTEQIRAKEAFMPTYEKIKKLTDEGKVDEASEIVDNLSDEEYEILKSIATTEKRANTIKNKTEFTSKYNEIVALKEKGEVEKVQSMIDNMTDDEYKAFTALAKEFKGKTTKQVNAEKTIIGLVFDYAKAYTIDPSNAFKAMFTSEKLGEVEGNLVELKRFKGIDFEAEGGSEEYVKQLLNKAGIPTSERSKYNLEHITPVKAGGGTNPENLYLVERDSHNSYTPVDVVATNLVKKGKLTRGQVTKVMNRLKIEKVITPDEAIIELNNLAK